MRPDLTHLMVWIAAAAVSVGSLAAQAPEISTVRQGASFAEGGRAAPGSIVSIFGSRIASSVAGTATSTLSTQIPLATSLGGVSVTFNGVEAPLFAVIGTANFDQVNAQVPWNVNVSSGQLEMTVRRGTDSTTTMVPAADAQPGIFTLQFGPGPAIVTNVAFAGGPAGVVNGSFAHAPGTVCGALGNPPGCTASEQPATIGGIVTIWCTGLGPVTPAVPSGTTPAQVGIAELVRTTKAIRVFIGGTQAEVVGGVGALQAAFVALNQINVFIPNVPPGNAVPIQIEMDLSSGGTFRTRADATIAVRAAPAALALP
jgi:uncharacterized protein (TIGR03437 family)